MLGSSGERLDLACTCLAKKELGMGVGGLSLELRSRGQTVFLPLRAASGSKQPSRSLAKKRSQSRKYGQAMRMASKV